jgi:hypothetical protein
MPAHLLNMSTDRNVNQEAIRDMSTRKQVNRLYHVKINENFSLNSLKKNYKEFTVRTRES